MSNQNQFECPLCGNLRTIRINRRSKPYLRCDDCGVLMFVNSPSGIRRMGYRDKPKTFAVRKEEAVSSLFGS